MHVLGALEHARAVGVERGQRDGVDQPRLQRRHDIGRRHDLPALALVCLLFLLCSLGLGLLISAFSRTQTQAIQFSVFFLLPVFVLSGAFAPLEQLPQAIRYIAELFPLTHFCRAFRLVNMYGAGLQFYVNDLVILLAGAVITFLGAAFLLRRIEQ